ncbi:MAG TPA: alpha/beta fold hydrolase [Desulfobacterales bacterium]|nr:alpha/beta fold hydrolase [Desulfobacterales bacterium]
MKPRRFTGRSFRGTVRVFSLIAALVLSGCATPVGVRSLDSKEANRRLTETVLSNDKLSAPTLQILNRAGLEKQFQSEPAAAITALHKALPTAREADRLFALAELSFLHAAKSGDRSYFFAAAVYAYAFLFPQDSGASPDPFDPRFRTAVDLYNRGISGGFAEPENRQVLIPERRRVILEEGVYRLPFGELSVHVDPEEFRYGPFRMVSFVDTAELEVRGLRNTYRWPGIGASLAAALKHRPGAEEREFAMVPATLRVAATAFLRLENVEEGIRTGRMEGRLTLYTTQEETSVTIGNRVVPLEYALTAALADTLEGSQAYAIELKGLFSGDFAILKDTARFKDNVFLMAPYRPGRIPLVLVHGTASSPARWAQMLNEILNDRELWNRYQVWLFTYNTGNPILYSGGILTQGLRNVVQELDPAGKDSALRKIVVIGHSQGGLLTKLTAIDSGDRFWEQAFNVPIDRMDVSSDTRELLRRSLYYEPLPFVHRVVFISTPHHGSHFTGGYISDLLRRLISLPGTLLSPLQEVFQRSPEAVTARAMGGEIPRSTDNMSPSSHFIKTFSSIPIAPGVIAHSIIAVANPEDPQAEWDDGVVPYKSAHIDGVDSELGVHSGPSAQESPLAIEEVRRILVENLKD